MGLKLVVDHLLCRQEVPGSFPNRISRNIQERNPKKDYQLRTDNTEQDGVAVNLTPQEEYFFVLFYKK